MHRAAPCLSSILVLGSTTLLAAENVRVGAYVTRLSDINPATGSFSAVVSVWTLSNSQSTLHPIQTLRLGDAHDVTSTTPSEVTNKGILWGYHEFTATLNQNLDMRHFPFDQHTLKIRIIEISWSAKNLQYVADSAGTRVDPRLDIPGWKVTGTRIETHLLTYPTSFGNPSAAAAPSSTWSEAWVLVDVRRHGLGIFAKLVLLAYISFALLMLSFLMGPLFESRVSLLVGCLFATVANMGGGESFLGKSNAFTLVDQIHLLVAFFILVSACTALLTRNMEAQRARRIDRWTAVASLTGFVVANLVLIAGAFVSW